MMKYKEKKKILQKFENKSGEKLYKLYLKSDLILLADVFEEVNKISIKEYGINHPYCVSLPGYTWQCGIKYTDIRLQENFSR